MKSNNKKICVVGAGNWGMNHIRTLYSLGALGGVVDSDIKQINNINDEYIDIDIFTDLNSAIELGFDGFIVATPVKTHFNIAKVIIESGNHVLIEKPITNSLKDAIELVDLAKKKNVNLMVGHLLLFHPAFVKIKEMVDNGDLGSIQYVYSNRLNYGTVRNFENVFWSLAPHDISLFQFLIESKPLHITSNGIDILQDGIHDTTLTTIEYPNKIMGHIFVSWLHPFKEHRFIIVGSEGMLHFEDSTDGKPLIFYKKDVEFDKTLPVLKKKSAKNIDYKFNYPLEEELKYFIDHLDGSPIIIGNGENALEVMEILDTATEKLSRN